MTYGEKMRNDGWKNAYVEPPKEAGEYLVEDRAGNRFKSVYCTTQFGNWVWKGRDKGYDICWWKKGDGK